MFFVKGMDLSSIIYFLFLFQSYDFWPFVTWNRKGQNRDNYLLTMLRILETKNILQSANFNIFMRIRCSNNINDKFFVGFKR
jgi:hypothetical protein